MLCIGSYKSNSMITLDQPSQVKQNSDEPEFGGSNVNLNLNSSSNYISSYAQQNQGGYAYPPSNYVQNPYYQFGYPQGYDQNYAQQQQQPNYPTTDPNDSYLMQSRIIELSNSLSRELEANKVLS